MNLSCSYKDYLQCSVWKQLPLVFSFDKNYTHVRAVDDIIAMKVVCFMEENFYS